MNRRYALLLAALFLTSIPCASAAPAVAPNAAAAQPETSNEAEAQTLKVATTVRFGSGVVGRRQSAECRLNLEIAAARFAGLLQQWQRYCGQSPSHPRVTAMAWERSLGRKVSDEEPFSHCSV